MPDVRTSALSTQSLDRESFVGETEPNLEQFVELR